MEETGGLPSLGLHRVGHNRSNLTCIIYALEKETATHSSILAWEIPRTEEPGGLQSVVWQSQTRLSDFNILTSGLCMKQNKNPRDRAEGEFLKLAVGCPGEKPGLGPR